MGPTGQFDTELVRLFDQVADMFGVAGLDGYLKLVNSAWARTVGYSQEELLARPYVDIAHPDDVERIGEAVAGLAQGVDLRGFVARVVCADGSLRWIDWNASALPGEPFIYIFGRDITDRLRAEAELKALVEEQAALRRIATLVAEGVSPGEIFGAVSEEVGHLFQSSVAAVLRFDDESFVFEGVSKALGAHIPMGSRWPLAETQASTEVFRTGLPARRETVDWSTVSVELAAAGRRLAIKSTVSSPIHVQGRLWGTIAVNSVESLPNDTEQRLANFTALVGTAIANADTRIELAASRRRIVAASDEARRRIERDLHDGMQHRLITLALRLRATEAHVPAEEHKLRREIASVASGLASAVDELQELSRGIHPAILTRGGLGPALRALARRASLPVELEVSVEERLPAPVEVAAYYVVSEVLANAAKHAGATCVEISLERVDNGVVLTIRDDGVGGADPRRGTGLVGLADRVETLGGALRVVSRPGDGTRITVDLPIEQSTVEPESSG